MLKSSFPLMQEITFPINWRVPTLSGRLQGNSKWLKDRCNYESCSKDSLATQGGELPTIFNRGGCCIACVANISTSWTTATSTTTATRSIVSLPISRLQKLIYADRLNAKYQFSTESRTSKKMNEDEILSIQLHDKHRINVAFSWLPKNYMTDK